MGIDLWVSRSQCTFIRLMILGEVLVGEPLVLWTHMLRSIGLTVKEISMGSHDADARLSRLNPSAILSLGPSQEHARGVIHQLHGYPFIVTHHPQSILDNINLKKETYADLCLLSTVLYSSNE